MPVDYIAKRRRTGRRGDHAGAARSAVGPRGTCAQCGRGLMPALEHDHPFCLACQQRHKPTAPLPETVEHNAPLPPDISPAETPPTPRACPVPMRPDIGH